MPRHAYGGIGRDARVLNQAILSDTNPHDSKVTTLIPPSAVSYQLAIEANVRFVEMTAGDTMTGSTHTLVAAKGAFTAADVGATVVITGSVSNNSTFTVSSVTNATTVVFSAGGADETFTGAETVILTQTITVDGAWVILASDSADVPDDTPGATAGAKIAKFTDVTATVAPTVVAVAHGTASTLNQIVEIKATGHGAIKARFTASTGHGRAVAYVKSGSY